MHKYIASFESGCLYELLKRDYFEFHLEGKYQPEEEVYIEKKLKKIKNRIKHMSFQSLFQIEKLYQKLQKLDTHIWLIVKFRNEAN